MYVIKVNGKYLYGRLGNYWDMTDYWREAMDWDTFDEAEDVAKEFDMAEIIEIKFKATEYRKG